MVDAAILACAGLDRLGFAARINERLPTTLMLPAIGQGALALEARLGDARVRALVRPLSDPEAETTVAAERALLAALGVGCRTPVAGARHRRGRAPDRARAGRPAGRERDPARGGQPARPSRRRSWARRWERD